MSAKTMRRAPNNAKNIRSVFVSWIAALFATAVISWLCAQILIMQKLPLYSAIPMASLSVAFGAFTAALMQGFALEQNSAAYSIATAIAMILLCILAGFPSWQELHITVIGAARTAVILIAALAGNQIGRYMHNSKKTARRRK